LSSIHATIEVEHLSHHYGGVHAVDDISFSVSEGEVFGLLGHNGAGKTTTIRMLTGRTRPTSGSARIDGHDVVADFDRIKPRINLVVEDQNLYERLSGRDNLRLFAQLFGQPVTRVDYPLKLVGLNDAAKRRVKTYSSGMKQRLLVARTLVNEPHVLYLDEPTRGLDPASARAAPAYQAAQHAGYDGLLDDAIYGGGRRALSTRRVPQPWHDRRTRHAS
jgi:ABC-2 type transport system ATP-binding protein